MWRWRSWKVLLQHGQTPFLGTAMDHDAALLVLIWASMASMMISFMDTLRSMAAIFRRLHSASGNLNVKFIYWVS